MSPQAFRREVAEAVAVLRAQRAATRRTNLRILGSSVTVGFLLAVLIVCTSGCSTLPAVPTTVSMPVAAAACQVAVPARPDCPLPEPVADVQATLRAITAHDRCVTGWGLELETLLISCTKAPKP
jgi:hypothetical protein